MENKGFRLISYESLEPGEGDEVIFFKNVNGYDNLPYLYLAIKKNKNEVYYTNLDTEYDVPAFWDYVEEEINLIDTSDIKEYKRLKYNTPWERTKKRILSFQKVTQKQKYIFSNGFQPNINHNNINVNCIVGKNGCGKSTIIEMIVRIINNLAFAFFGTEFRDNGDYHLYYIENIFASLSFSINENMYTIEIKGRIIDIYKNNRLIISRKLDFESDYYYKTSQSFEGLDELAEIIQFTTIVFNYSVYSYTDWDNIELDEESKDEHYFNWCYKENQPSNIMLETNWCAHFNIFNTPGYEIPININPRRINNKYIDIKSNRVISTLNILKLCLFYREENGILKYPLRQFIPNKRIIKLDLAYGFGAPLLKGKHYNYAKKWAKTFEIKIKQLDSTTQEYIENKTIKIAKKYYNSQFDSLNEFEKENILNKIIKDKSHKTEKIRHILIWFKLFSELEIVKRKKEFDLDYDIRISNEIDNEGFREILFMERTIYMDKNGCIYNYDKQSFFKHRNIKIDIFHLLPPIHWIEDIVCEDMETNYIIEFSKLSSGEKQLAFLRSNLLYHLYNVNSNHYSTGKDIRYNKKYDYVNIIFDEVELYLHPEWQRQFISTVVEGINLAKFENIKGYNILISTHSPFILSDVPKSNVMFLDNGKQIPNDQIEYETFGANIHDLLKSGFFMESTIGEFARKQIQEIVDKYYEFKEGKYSPNDSDKERYLYIQSIIGDQYYKNTLKFMLEEIFGLNPEDEIERLEREIKEKQERLNQLKGGQ